MIPPVLRPGFPALLTPAETRAALGGIGEDKLVRLADSGKIRFAWTPGHTRRYYADSVEALIAAGGVQ